METRKRRRRWSKAHFALLLVGLLAFFLNFLGVRTWVRTVRVATAAQPLRSGSVLSAGKVVFVDARMGDEVLETLIQPDDLTDFEGWVTVGPIASGGVLARTNLRPPEKSPVARRSMSVPVSPSLAVGGAIRTGDRVDIIAVEDGVARYVLVGAEVLAVLQPGAGKGVLGGGRSEHSLVVSVDAVAALELAWAIATRSVQVVQATGAAPAERQSRFSPQALRFPSDLHVATDVQRKGKD